MVDPEIGEVKYHNRGESEVVMGDELSKMMKEWIMRWLADRPRNITEMGKGSFKGSVEFMGPIDWLGEKTGIHLRRVSGLCNGEFPMVPLTQADALLTAIGRPEALYNGEVRVIPNPGWTNERWIEYMRENGAC